jgi:hypothetical protein
MQMRLQDSAAQIDSARHPFLRRTLTASADANCAAIVIPFGSSEMLARPSSPNGAPVNGYDRGDAFSGV